MSVETCKMKQLCLSERFFAINNKKRLHLKSEAFLFELSTTCMSAIATDFDNILIICILAVIAAIILIFRYRTNTSIVSAFIIIFCHKTLLVDLQIYRFRQINYKQTAFIRQ